MEVREGMRETEGLHVEENTSSANRGTFPIQCLKTNLLNLKTACMFYWYYHSCIHEHCLIIIILLLKKVRWRLVKNY